MAKTKPSKTPVVSESGPAGASPPAPQPSQIRFGGVLVKRIMFEELPKTERKAVNPERPDEYSMELGLAVNVTLRSPTSAEVTLVMEIKPDPSIKPYAILVELVGLFSTVDATQEQLADFCRFVAPTTLFPYVREVVSRTTADGRYGAVRLQPMNLLNFLSKGDWRASSPGE
jgi:preprotein translocase subunit SecB